jgi:hypothetical protein
MVVDMVVELRRYTLHPGMRETLIELFERELVEPQEAVGMSLLGWFRDLDDPDAFVWLRAFDDMPSRADALTAFYRGPVWAAHRDAANATMIDSDDVLLLRPVPGGPTLRRGDVPADGRLVITTYHLREPADRGFLEAFTSAVDPAGLAGLYVTDPTPNTWPALPVREGEEVLVALNASSATPTADEDLAAWFEREPTITRLAPPQKGGSPGS